MKKVIIIIALMVVLLYGCVDDVDIPPTQEPETIDQPIDVIPPEGEEFTVRTFPDTIKIASFNIQIFGKSKREKEDVMEILVKTVRQFDIVAVQEVRDKSEETIPYFINKINEVEGSKYDYVISPRLGRTSSKEQYVFIYDTDTVTYKDFSYVYDDSSDVFEREPFIATFQSGDFDFTLVNIHTKPDDATAEIQALVDVINDADVKVQDDEDIIVLGDFNADGSYFSESTTDGLRADEYLWIVPDNFDTTVAASDNTYDRIVARKEYTGEDSMGAVAVFDFDYLYNLSEDFTKQVSDHYPVWTWFYTNRDTD